MFENEVLEPKDDFYNPRQGWRRLVSECLVSECFVSECFGTFVLGYIALAGLWGSPISGTSMNPARTFGPDLVGADFSSYWGYIARCVGACRPSMLIRVDQYVLTKS